MENQMIKNSMIDALNKKGPVHEYDDLVGSFASSSSSSSSSSSLSGISSASSLESDSFEEVTSPTSSSSDDQVSAEPLNDMSSLFQQLPIKRGLSKFYQGKSQSFTSLTKVMSLEDLAKPENPYNKKLKSCKSYGGLSESHRTKCNPISAMSRNVSKRVSCSSLSARKGNVSFISSKPPIPPHRSTSTNTIPNQTALFA